MGLFDFLKPKAKSVGAGSAAPSQDKNVVRLARAASDSHAQNYDRMEALENLSRIHSTDAAAALLRRFKFNIEPSITDQEEKEVAFQGIVACGDEAIGPIATYCEKAESLTWPLKILRTILPPEKFVEEVVEMLSDHETDYSRNVDPKIQLLATLEGHPGKEEEAEVLRFLEDVSEPVRFQAVITLLSYDSPAVAERLVALALEEESVRIRNKIAEGFIARGWVVPEENRDRLASVISVGGFGLDAAGRVVTYLLDGCRPWLAEHALRQRSQGRRAGLSPADAPKGLVSPGGPRSA